MWIAKTIDQVRHEISQKGGTTALVPTMGALHEGHLSLVRIAGSLADHVLVSIFVNPAQFGPKEDFDRYPRPLEDDLRACEALGVTGVFCPSVDQMYPPGAPACEMDVPVLTRDLEGAARPGHLPGVCRVVAKLLNIFEADFACFGRKDYQQMRVIQAMAADMAHRTKIIECPTVRESDGLAMSTRNAQLGPAQRRRSVGLQKALGEAKMLVEREGQADPRVIEAAMLRVMAAHQIKVDYAVVRHPLTLAPLDRVDPARTGGVVALVAGSLGAVRLIDNMVLGESKPST